MVKPDGVQRGLIGDIIKRFEQKGFKLVAMKFMQVRRTPVEYCIPFFVFFGQLTICTYIAEDKHLSLYFSLHFV